MSINEIHAELLAMRNSPALFAIDNFALRAVALDELEFAIIDRIDRLLETGHPPTALTPLKQAALELTQELEAIDIALFTQLRAAIRSGVWEPTRFRAEIQRILGDSINNERPQPTIGYGLLDVLLNGILQIQSIPIETRTREPEMIYYQPTPARIIVELIEQAQLTSQDVFFDLGSGLGHVPIMVNLLSGAQAVGVEYEPAYYATASACAAELSLNHVTFINTDARIADYTSGTVFFMYTPFTGTILEDVLATLRAQAHTRTIRICTYGPCTQQVGQHNWLAGAQRSDPNRLAVFWSR